MPKIDLGKVVGADGKNAVFVRNLLDNSDFTNPVNQRGQTTYYNAEYSIDRWIMTGGATLNIIKNTWIETNNYLRQRLPVGVLDSNKQYTVAYKTEDGTIHISYNSVSFTSKDYGYNYDEVYINLEGATVAIIWAALYEGFYTADTLPPYMPKGYAVELLECQRYYTPLQTDPFGYGYIGDGGGSAYINLATPVKMRITPSLGHSGNGNISIRAGGSNIQKSVGSYGLTIVSYSSTCVCLKITLNDTMPNVHSASGFWDETLKPYLSADL